MTRRITLIRHGETEANTLGGWQGQSDSTLTGSGRAQVARLAERLGSPPLVISSDLGRAATSAEPLGAPEFDERWREYHFGDWEGLTTVQIEERFPGGLDGLRSDEDFRPDGGESQSEFRTRIMEAFTAAADRIDDGEEVVVVTHGGLIHALVGAILGADRRSLALPRNTGITTIVLDANPGTQVRTFNDATHLDGDLIDNRERRVVLFRHAQTQANVDHRWYGRGESPLTDVGRAQAAALAATAPALDVIAASPLSRARDTAGSVADAQGCAVEVVDDLIEMYFGEWEGLTAAEIEAVDPAGFARVYGDGVDAARGGHGETFAEAGARLARAIDAIVAASDGAHTIGVFTHGGVSRAYTASLLGIPFSSRHVLPEVSNCSHTEIVLGSRGPRLLSYNVPPQLQP